MFPCLASSGGNFQDASILVEVLAVREKLLGGCEGTAIEKYFKLNEFYKRLNRKTCQIQDYRISLGFNH